MKSWKKKASIAYGYSLNRLVLNYYMFQDQLFQLDSEVEEISKTCDQIVKGVIDDTLDIEKAIKIREKNSSEVETIVAFMDCFSVYKKVLERIEGRFETLKHDSIPDQELTQLVLNYIRSQKDSLGMNIAINSIVSELPIRYTTEKFLSVVSDAMALYKGNDQYSFYERLENLKSVSSLALELCKQKRYPNLEDALEQLRILPWKSMDQQSYQRAWTILESAELFLQEIGERRKELQDIINDCCILTLTKLDAVKDSKENSYARKIIQELYECTVSEDGIPDEISIQLTSLEGLQEEYLEKYMRLQQDETESKESRLVELLLSTSSFVKLLEEPKEGIVTEEIFHEKMEEVLIEMKDNLKSYPLIVRRSVMANILDVLPLHYASLEEFEDYLINALSICEDPIEKDASKIALLKLMEYGEYAMV